MPLLVARRQGGGPGHLSRCKTKGSDTAPSKADTEARHWTRYTHQPSPVPYASDGRAGPVFRCPRPGGDAIQRPRRQAITRTLSGFNSNPQRRCACRRCNNVDCLFIKQNLWIIHFLLWITPVLSPLSPQPSKLRGQLQAPVYAVSPLSPLVPAQKNMSVSKTGKNNMILFPGLPVAQPMTPPPPTPLKRYSRAILYAGN